MDPSPAAEPQSKEKYLRKIKKLQIRQLEQKNAEGSELLTRRAEKLRFPKTFADELRGNAGTAGDASKSLKKRYRSADLFLECRYSVIITTYY